MGPWNDLTLTSTQPSKMSNASAGSSTDVGVNTTNSNSSLVDANVPKKEVSNSSAVDADIPKKEVSNDGDSCTWYSGAVCSRPRSCFDCLNVIIPGHDCAISPYGECMSSYMVPSVGGYSMNNFTYCPLDDSVCTACRANWTRNYMAGIHVSLIDNCVGQSGCVCLASCEVPDYDNRIVKDWCIPTLSGSQFRLVTGLVAGTIALVVVASIITKRQLARHRRQDAENREARLAARATLRGSRRPSASAHLPQLSLSGWANMREKLISSEHSRLEEGNGSGSTHPTLARSSTTPASTIIEEGDGYRPISPSERSLRREV